MRFSRGYHTNSTQHYNKPSVLTVFNGLSGKGLSIFVLKIHHSCVFGLHSDYFNLSNVHQYSKQAKVVALIQNDTFVSLGLENVEIVMATPQNTYSSAFIIFIKYIFKDKKKQCAITVYIQTTYIPKRYFALHPFCYDIWPSQNAVFLVSLIYVTFKAKFVVNMCLGVLPDDIHVVFTISVANQRIYKDFFKIIFSLALYVKILRVVFVWQYVPRA